MHRQIPQELKVFKKRSKFFYLFLILWFAFSVIASFERFNSRYFDEYVKNVIDSSNISDKQDAAVGAYFVNFPIVEISINLIIFLFLIFLQWLWIKLFIREKLKIGIVLLYFFTSLFFISKIYLIIDSILKFSNWGFYISATSRLFMLIAIVQFLFNLTQMMWKVYKKSTT